MDWQNMPEHLYFLIFRYLGWGDILNSSQVCYEWHEAVRRSKAWLENTEFAITQYQWYNNFKVVEPEIVKKLSCNYQNLVVRGFVVEEWCQQKFEQMCSTFSSMVQQCDIRGFTLTVPVGSRFLREFLLSNEQHLQTVEDFTLCIQDTFCDSHTYKFIVNFGAIRRIRILQSPLIDLLSNQAIQINTTYLEDITLCSNSSLGIMFNNPKAKLKQLRIFVHSYHNRMTQEVISIQEFILETLVIECSSIAPWIDYIINFLVPLLGPLRLVINQRQMMEESEMNDIAQLFKETDTGLNELVLTVKKNPFCECGYVI